MGKAPAPSKNLLNENSYHYYLTESFLSTAFGISGCNTAAAGASCKLMVHNYSETICLFRNYSCGVFRPSTLNAVQTLI